jgi:hypothetical protein
MVSQDVSYNNGCLEVFPRPPATSISVAAPPGLDLIRPTSTRAAATRPGPLFHHF